jgi:hypothetical protein
MTHTGVVKGLLSASCSTCRSFQPEGTVSKRRMLVEERLGRQVADIAVRASRHSCENTQAIGCLADCGRRTSTRNASPVADAAVDEEKGES